MGELRVCLDARFRGYPGIGRFVIELWRGLLELGVEVVAFTNRRPGHVWLATEGPLSPGPERAIRARPFRPLEQVVVPHELERSRASVYHSPHLTVPYLSRRPVVLTVHDLFPLREPRNARSTTAGLYYRTMFPHAVRKAATVVAVSPYSAGEVQDLLGVPDHKLRVVEHGVDEAKWRPQDDAVVQRSLARVGVRQPFLLYVGTVKRHKNLPTLLEAVLADASLPPLVLAGPTLEEIRSARPALDANGRIVALGRVPDDLLPSLYSGATAVVLPSLYEAVGFTALEALACGTPVVASSGGGLPATVGPGGLLVPPTDVSAWVDALKTVTQDAELRGRLAEAGREHVKHRTWKVAAQSYLRIYEEAGGAVFGG